MNSTVSSSKFWEISNKVNEPIPSKPYVKNGAQRASISNIISNDELCHFNVQKSQNFSKIVNLGENLRFYLFALNQILSKNPMGCGWSSLGKNLTLNLCTPRIVSTCPQHQISPIFPTMNQLHVSLTGIQQAW